MSNSYSSTDDLQTLELLKQNISRSINVCKVAIVKSIDDNGSALCQDLNNSNLIIKCSIKTQNVSDISPGSIVLIICTDQDYRTNIRRVLQSARPIDYETKVLHNINYGIIFGIIGGQNE